MVRATRSATRTSPRSRSSGKTTGRSRRPMHPSWTEMITDCIVTTPDGTQNGVSRPTLKKFVEFNYHPGQLNRAITVGTEKGNFVLPKGSHNFQNAKQNSKRVSSAKTTTTMHPRKTATATKKYTSRAKKGRTTSTSTASRKTAKKPSTEACCCKEVSVTWSRNDIKGTSRSTARAKTLKRPSVSSSTRRRASAK
ncbi:hypothetical protein BKA83DRAFT_139234 [Pisolithus microcarpus]|nr:hypothetical protein BKA83DRAFT_139234 [Pisolithus microcarpus]